jgi:hypothetical protein
VVFPPLESITSRLLAIMLRILPIHEAAGSTLGRCYPIISGTLAVLRYEAEAII